MGADVIGAVRSGPLARARTSSSSRTPGTSCTSSGPPRSTRASLGFLDLRQAAGGQTGLSSSLRRRRFGFATRSGAPRRASAGRRAGPGCVHRRRRAARARASAGGSATRPAGRAGGWRRPRLDGAAGRGPADGPAAAEGKVSRRGGRAGSGSRSSARSFQVECRRPSTTQRTRASTRPSWVRPAQQLAGEPDAAVVDLHGLGVACEEAHHRIPAHPADCRSAERPGPEGARASRAPRGRAVPPLTPVPAATPGGRTPPRPCTVATTDAGWSSSVARWAHNPEVTGSNPVPATTWNGPHSRTVGAVSASADAGTAPGQARSGRRAEASVPGSSRRSSGSTRPAPDRGSPHRPRAPSAAPAARRTSSPCSRAPSARSRPPSSAAR